VDAEAEEEALWKEFKATSVADHHEMRRIRRMVARLRTREPLRDFSGRSK